MAIRIPAEEGKSKQNLRRNGKWYEFARSTALCFVLLRGERIATPRRPKVRHAQLPWGSPPRKRYPFAGAPALVRNDMLKVVTRLRLQGGLARGVRKNLPRGCKGKGQFSSPGCKKSTGAKQALLRPWQGMRDSNPRKRSQSPVCYRYTNPLF